MSRPWHDSHRQECEWSRLLQGTCSGKSLPALTVMLFAWLWLFLLHLYAGRSNNRIAFNMIVWRMLGEHRQDLVNDKLSAHHNSAH